MTVIRVYYDKKRKYPKNWVVAVNNGTFVESELFELQAEAYAKAGLKGGSKKKGFIPKDGIGLRIIEK